MCHYSDRAREPTHESLEELLAEHAAESAEEDDPGFAEMEEAEDVEIVTDGGE